MNVTAVQRFFQISSSVFNREKYVLQVWNRMRVSHFSIVNFLNKPTVLLRLVCYSLFIYHIHCGRINVSAHVFIKQITQVKAHKIFICSLFYFDPIRPFSHLKLKQHFYSIAPKNRLQFSHCLHKCTAYADRNAVSIKAQYDVVAVKLLLRLLQFIYTTEPESYVYVYASLLT